MVDSSNRLKMFSIDIPTEEGIYQEHIDITADNLEDIINTIAYKLNLDNDYIKDIIVKKVISSNKDITRDKQHIPYSGVNNSMNISVEKSVITQRYSTLTLKENCSRSGSANVGNDSVSKGERMYRKAIVLRDMKVKMIKQKQTDKSQQISKECTFKPRINSDKFVKVDNI